MQERLQQVLRRLPSVEELVQSDGGRSLLVSYGRERVVDAIREAIAEAREEARALLESDVDGPDDAALEALASPDALTAAAGRLLSVADRPHLRRVINATGVVLHTNLGRSLLADAATERVREVAQHYSNLEYRLEEGERGSRHEHVEALLCRLTGAEAAMVVNNNAAAVLLMLTALAQGREVVVSRGQLVEIGGSFRIPDIMRLSGARLVEVGTTNKTHRYDFERAISPETALLLRVHTSNFKVVGFAEEVPIEELVAVAGAAGGLLVADDLGSGVLVDLPVFRDEPSVASSLAAGADVVSFSGDKLLGGPQAGLLVGHREVIQTLKQHPLARAVRVDKMTLAALEGTLLLYQDPERVRELLPTLRYLDRDPAETSLLAATLVEEVRKVVPDMVDVEVEETAAKAGGGSLPLLELPSHAVGLRFESPTPVPAVPGGPWSPTPPSLDALAQALRRAPVPVIGRVAQDVLLLDVLTLEGDQLHVIAESLAWALAELGVPGRAAVDLSSGGIEPQAPHMTASAPCPRSLAGPREGEGHA